MRPARSWRASVGSDMARHYTGDARLLRPGLRILDCVTGSEFERRGVSCALPLWPTHALLHAPEVCAGCTAITQPLAPTRSLRTRVCAQTAGRLPSDTNCVEPALLPAPSSSFFDRQQLALPPNNAAACPGERRTSPAPGMRVALTVARRAKSPAPGRQPLPSWPSRGASGRFFSSRRAVGPRTGFEARKAKRLGLLHSAPKTPPRCALRLLLTGLHRVAASACPARSSCHLGRWSRLAR